MKSNLIRTRAKAHKQFGDIMKKFLAILAIVGLIGVFDFIPVDADAKSRSSFGSSRSSWGSSKSKSYSKSSSTKNRSTTSTFKKQSPAEKAAARKKSIAEQKQRQAQADAKAKKEVEAKRSKALASKDKQAFSKYKTKADAEKAYRSSLPQNNYTSKTPPATRPAHIPATTSVDGKTVNVTYNSYGNGSYGYGYYNPMGTFVSLAASMYIIDSMQMRNAGYGNWDASGRPVYPPRDGIGIFGIILITLLIGAIIVGVVISTRETA